MTREKRRKLSFHEGQTVVFSILLRTGILNPAVCRNASISEKYKHLGSHFHNDSVSECFNSGDCVIRSFAGCCTDIADILNAVAYEVAAPPERQIFSTKMRDMPIRKAQCLAYAWPLERSLKKSTYRSRHCFPMRPGSSFANNDHFPYVFPLYSCTSRVNLRSSYMRQQPNKKLIRCSKYKTVGD